MACLESAGSGHGRGWSEAHRLGWKAMPFALDDLDSNYKVVSGVVGEPSAVRNVPL